MTSSTARKRTVIALFLTTMFLLMPFVAVPVVATEPIIENTEKQEKDVKPTARVGIFYDSELDSFVETAFTIQNTLRKVKLDTYRYGVHSSLFMEHLLDCEELDIAIYIFQSNLEGITIRGDLTLWSEVADIVATMDETDHLFGIGNAERLKDYTGDMKNVHTEKTQMVDVRLTALYSLWTTYEVLAESGVDSNQAAGKRLRDIVMQDFCDNINEYVSKSVIPEDYTGEDVPEPIDDPRLTETWAEEIKQYDDEGEELKPMMRLTGSSPETTALAAEEGYISMRDMSPKSGVGGAIGWVLDKVLAALTGNGFENLQLHEDAADIIVNYFEDLINDTRGEIIDWFDDKGFNVAAGNYSDALPDLLPSEMMELWNFGDQKILDAWYEADDWLVDYIDGIVNTPVQTDLRGLVPVFLLRLGTPLNLGSNFASFGVVLRVKLVPTFEVDKTFFQDFMKDAVFGDYNLSSYTDVVNAFGQVRGFIDVIPLMDIDLAICAFLPTENDWVAGMMGGLTIDFFGHAWMQLAFPPIDASGTDRSFIEVRSWGLRFELDASYTITIATFLTGGAGGILSTILSMASAVLDASITLTLSVILEISKKYQGQGLPALSTFLLDIVVGVTLSIRILVIVFKGTFKVGMRFEQTSGNIESSSLLAGAEEPVEEYLPASGVASSFLGIYLTLYCSLYLGIDLWLTSFGTHFGGPWTDTYDLSVSYGETEYGQQSADLTDSDLDGLPDDFETRMNTLYGSTYLNPASSDTDSDGLNDKLELELNTAPNDADTDDDGLNDKDEHTKWLTSPLLPDSDYDNLTDYEECITYGTNALVIDTDGDLLYDWYEVHTTYDITYTEGTYGAVESVTIGGVEYNDRTDPLNPDTDNDGLIDGEEWDNGVEYVNQSMLDSGEYPYVYMKYTHPLDADTDDDSVLWFFSSDWNDPFYPSNAFLTDMSDGVEVRGQYATIPDIEGFPETKLVKTNPCMPDTDNDTGSGVALFNTDGYELTLDPPTDPTDGDTDDDLIKDGKEVIGPGGTGTDARNPDTDNDNLPDYEDWMLPTDQRDPDTDDDTVLDGDEYYIYGTNPLLNDTDSDGLTDGEELFYFYCNPTVRDSDLDGLTDGEEILIYLTDPLLPDTDGDNLTDGYEVKYSHTDPRVFDTDGDRLGDGEELLVYESNPLDWDSDHDSLEYPNELGEMTLPLGDGDEVLDYGTDPNSIDSDSDGLTDSQEIYLGIGAPSFDPIPLDPLDNDTDDDNLIDGDELILENVSIITYPYVGLKIRLRYGSCPVKNDTDGDGLRDDLELANSTRADYWDTDDDSLSDYVELFETGTNPLSNDTDGDEIPDGLEVHMNNTPSTNSTYSMASLGFTPAQDSLWPLFPTSATDSDTDDDLLPDGLELLYGTDPMDPDDNENGILDGYEFDADNDGLSDGEEFYIYQTWLAPLPIEDGKWVGDPGGFSNPDSDGDGIDDGTEVNTYGSDPTSTDSDGDGVSDGDEVNMGGDPLVPITSGYPTWMLLAIGGAVGLVAGIVLPPMLRFTRDKLFGGKKSTKKSKKKKKSSKKSKKEGDSK